MYNEGMLIEPKVLKGFRDFLPADEIPRRGLVERIEVVYRLYGYVPIDTPALEYAEILLGKGGGETEKQVYRFTDAGGRDIALRFDLTVPLARFTAANLSRLTLPFKRYHIAKVWRGENTQRGRYREFMQCDCDTIGDDSDLSDFEILCMMRDALGAAGAGAVSIHINHRGLFNRFLDRIGEREKSVAILRTVDKLAKIGRDETLALLAAICGDKNAAEIVNFVTTEGGWDETLEKLTGVSGGGSPETERLHAIRRFMLDAGIADSFKLDPSITRGLDYYTGIVYETFLTEMPEIGSVCSGGRYGDLAGLYTKEKLSGAGASIGLDRLIAALAALGRLPARATYAAAAIAALDAGQAGLYQKAAGELRGAGIACEVLGADAKKLTAFFINAEKRGLRYALFRTDEAAGADMGQWRFTLRNLAARKNTESLSIHDVVKYIQDERL